MIRIVIEVDDAGAVTISESPGTAPASSGTAGPDTEVTTHNAGSAPEFALDVDVPEEPAGITAEASSPPAGDEALDAGSAPPLEDLDV
jgi:hypothetical protein